VDGFIFSSYPLDELSFVAGGAVVTDRSTMIERQILPVFSYINLDIQPYPKSAHHSLVSAPMLKFNQKTPAKAVSKSL
jgi:hypothetical protein